MIAAWVVHGLVVSALLAGAAFLAERALRLQGRAARGVWVAAMAGSLLLPTARALLPAGPAGAARLGDAAVIAAPRGATADDAGAPALERAVALVTAGLDGAEAAAAGVADWIAVRVRGVPGLATGLLLLWGLVSLGVALVLARSARRLGRERRRWRRVRVSDVDVLVSRDRGPGVVGLRRAEIVLPAWVLDLEEGLQRLVCLHEREHVRAGDHRLFAVALAAVALLPWNLPLWWHLRRLRLAIECDCDRRVLCRDVSPRLYGELLLRVGGRPSRMPLLTAPLAERKSHLARRIDVMTSGNVEHREARTLAAVAVASGLAFLSCEAPAPTEEEAGTTGPDAAESSFQVRELEGGDATQPTGEERPLVVLDGEVQGSGTSLESLEPERIERIEVLKGPAAREAYGDRGAHGVIEITTKGAGSGASADGAGAESSSGERPARYAPGQESRRPSFIPYDTPPRLSNPGTVLATLQEKYPTSLRQAGVGGRALLWVYVDESGRVGNVIVKESAGRQALDRAAMAVARHMEFTPARNGGEPTAVWVTQPITFEVEEAGPAGDPTAGSAPAAAERASGAAAPADGGFDVRVSGSGRLASMEDALLIVDGVVQEDHSALESLDPERIDRIEVLKGPVAVGTYGERAREGAVHVFTKGSGGG